MYHVDRSAFYATARPRALWHGRGVDILCANMIPGSDAKDTGLGRFHVRQILLSIRLTPPAYAHDRTSLLQRCIGKAIVVVSADDLGVLVLGLS